MIQAAEEAQAVSIGKIALLDDEILRAIGPEFCVVVDGKGRVYTLLLREELACFAR